MTKSELLKELVFKGYRLHSPYTCCQQYWIHRLHPGVWYELNCEKGVIRMDKPHMDPYWHKYEDINPEYIFSVS